MVRPRARLHIPRARSLAAQPPVGLGTHADTRRGRWRSPYPVLAASTHALEPDRKTRVRGKWRGRCTAYGPFMVDQDDSGSRIVVALDRSQHSRQALRRGSIEARP